MKFLGETLQTKFSLMILWSVYLVGAFEGRIFRFIASGSPKNISRYLTMSFVYQVLISEFYLIFLFFSAILYGYHLRIFFLTFQSSEPSVRLLSIYSADRTTNREIHIENVPLYRNCEKIEFNWSNNDIFGHIRGNVEDQNLIGAGGIFKYYSFPTKKFLLFPL